MNLPEQWHAAISLPARRYAGTVLAITVCPSVCHTPVLRQNG